MAGDVHPNPGPDHNSKYFTICRANVRSMQSQEKLDEIYYMAETYSIDVIIISETWPMIEMNFLILYLDQLQWL